MSETSATDTAVVSASKSRYANNPMYACNPKTGKYKLAKGYKRVAVAGAPQKGLTAYFRWLADGNRERLTQELKATQPTIKPTEVTRQLGSAWKALTKAQQQPYLDSANAEAEVYKTAVTNFGDNPRREIVKVENAKKGVNGYLLFAKEQRTQVKNDHPEATAKQIPTLLGQAWKTLSPEAQGDYNARAKQLAPTA